MIVNGTIANGGVQPFVMQQVMQIQDPQTGAIQTGQSIYFYFYLTSLCSHNTTTTATTVYNGTSSRSKFKYS